MVWDELLYKIQSNSANGFFFLIKMQFYLQDEHFKNYLQ